MANDGRFAPLLLGSRCSLNHDLPYPGLESRGIAAVIAAGGMLAAWMRSFGGAEIMREQLGPLAALVIIPVQAVVAVSPFPSELIALVTCTFYGFWGGALLAWCAWFVAAFLQYELVRRTAKDFDFEHARRRLPKRLRELPVSHPAFLILGRWLPYGPHIVNSAAGAYGISLQRHAWCAAVSIVPPALFISGLANGLLAP
jgi:uncharacterized membrane protein YdjX (TVP38/TMEM64 family)